MALAVILGIDPGFRTTGFGVVRMLGSKPQYVMSGCIRVAELPLAERLRTIYDGIKSVILECRPDEVAIEQVFQGKNADSALKLGQARGAAIVAAAEAGIAVSEYSARQVKQAVVGTGAADKTQVQMMVCKLLNLDGVPQADAADAIAIALCHGHGMNNLVHNAGLMLTRRRRGRMR